MRSFLRLLARERAVGRRKVFPEHEMLKHFREKNTTIWELLSQPVLWITFPAMLAAHWISLNSAANQIRMTRYNVKLYPEKPVVKSYVFRKTF